ncbi:DUF3772 domain-containing protein [Falsirhodobacter sp. 1013]|uniref:DUF3772 domain-containing protein n=1 Tax=Falsirhodobacter sp. 1013 TaxID=3417566 RepID=UPI003EBF15F0
MTQILRLVCLMFCLLLGTAGALPLPAAAQVSSALQDQVNLLNQASANLDTVRSALQTERARSDYDALRTQAQEAAATANATIGILTPRLTELQATLAAIGEPTDGEAPVIQNQRADLTSESDQLDSAVKQARLLVTSANETVEAINRAVTALFNKNVLERVASPFTQAYWQALFTNLPTDFDRLTNFFNAATNRFMTAMTVSGIAILSGALALAGLLLLPVRQRLNQLGQNYAAHRAPQTQLRRTGLALWFVTVGSLTSTLAFLIVVQALQWAGALTSSASSLAWTLLYAASFGAVTIALGSALLLKDKQSWRLLPIEDHDAHVLHPFLGVSAALAVLSAGLTEMNRIVGVSPSANVTGNLLIATLHVGLLISILIALRGLRGARDLQAGQVTERRSLMTVAMLVGWITVVVCVIALVRGNVNLALLMGREVLWGTIVISAAYLLMAAVDDIATNVFSENSPAGRSLTRGFGLRQSTVRQLGLIVSVLGRIAIGFLALSAILAPLGGGTGPAYTKISGISISSIAVGGIVIQLGAIARAAIVFAIGIAGIRMISGWLDKTYLPATELDAGARNSASTIMRYLGLAVVVTWAVSSLGIGMERLGLVVSALSVGIGFGLQAITQNFISGLILLAERPVKIGDTIRIGTDEGDVKRISVRSTEIQIGDRSTLIIPNSELITKNVRNLTLANPMGRIQIEFTVPMEEDADEVARVLLKLFRDHPAVFDDPKPSVYIDSLVEGMIKFNSFAFVASPRLVYGTRSDLLFRLLAELKARDVGPGHPPAAVAGMDDA